MLAFDNMSDDNEQEYFCDGMSEDILTALSKVRLFLVIARNSSFSYKGRNVHIRRIAEEVGSPPPFRLGAFRDVEEDLRSSMAAVRACPYLPHRDEVRGFLYEVETGDLREVS